MRAVEATIEVHEDGSAEVEIQGVLEPGQHHVWLMVEEPQRSKRGSGHLSLPGIAIGFPSELNFSRDEIYADG